MADNIGYTPGSGALVAADEIGGVLYQRMKLAVGEDGVAVDASLTNPIPAIIPGGELIEALEAMRMELNSIGRSIGLAMPDTAGRLRVVVDAISAALTLATITTVTTVTTVSTMTNQTQIGTNPAFEHIPALMHSACETFRRNITTS